MNVFSKDEFLCFHSSGYTASANKATYKCFDFFKGMDISML